MEIDQKDKGIFLVNLLAIVFDPSSKRILIAKRENDPNIKELSWVFPGGRPNHSNNLEDELKKLVNSSLNINLSVDKQMYAKTYPENNKILSIYYLCTYLGGSPETKEKFKEFKWIYPNEVNRYFTTSIHPRILEILSKLI
jgi:ADP-ribose pyrophosphatase YjhB (NUDIX family)